LRRPSESGFEYKNPGDTGGSRGTGLEDNVATHNDYGEDFIRSTQRVGKSLPIQEEATLPAYSVGLGVRDLQIRMSSRRTEIRRS